MARDYYIETITGVDADGTMKALANIEVKVKDGATSNISTIFLDRTGGTTSDSEFTISESTPGLIEFWANKGEYDIYIHDLNPIPRITDEVLHWTSTPLEDATIGFDLGDVKFSSKNSDHGRWLKMDGRELTQAEIESALGLSAGGGYAVTAELGTGSASKYGNAAAGKIKLPDTRRQIPMMAGPSGDGSGSFSARPLKGSGSSGGVEAVTLSSGQSGLPAHTHSASDPGHTHAPSGNRSLPSVTTLGWNGSGPSVNTSPNWTPLVTNNVGTSGEYVSGIESWDPAFDTFQEILTIGSSSTGISVSANSAVAAASSHENMPPFVTLGFAFIRV